MYYITPQRDLQRMDLNSLENLKAETERDIDEHDCGIDGSGTGHCKDHSRLNIQLMNVNKCIAKSKAGEEFIKGRQREREKINNQKIADYCGYDDVVLANNLF